MYPIGRVKDKERSLVETREHMELKEEREKGRRSGRTV